MFRVFAENEIGASEPITTEKPITAKNPFRKYTAAKLCHLKWQRVFTIYECVSSFVTIQFYHQFLLLEDRMETNTTTTTITHYHCYCHHHYITLLSQVTQVLRLSKSYNVVCYLSQLLLTLQLFTCRNCPLVTYCS